MAWAGGVCASAATVAGLVGTSLGSEWHFLVVVLVIISVAALFVLIDAVQDVGNGQVAAAATDAR